MLTIQGAGSGVLVPGLDSIVCSRARIGVMWACFTGMLIGMLLPLTTFS